MFIMFGNWISSAVKNIYVWKMKLRNQIPISNTQAIFTLETRFGSVTASKTLHRMYLIYI